MVQGSTDTIELQLVVDRAQLEGQLGQAFTATGPPSGKGVGAQGVPVSPSPSMGKMLAPLAKLTGIGLGMTALVRGSKVMSTTMGAFVTTMGAIVDSFLAPLVPLLLPVLENLQKYIPKAAAAGDAAVRIITSAKEELKADFGPGGMGPFMVGSQRPVGLPEDVSRGDVWKQAGQNLLDMLKDIAMRPSLFMTPKAEAEMRAGTGLGEPPLTSGGFRGEFNPRVEALGSGQFPLQMLERILEFNDEKMKAFIELRGSRPNVYNFDITGDNIDDIMAQVRTEVATVVRDQRSRGFGGG